MTDANLENLEGEKFTLSQMKGKVVLFDLWATWCGPCIDAIPEIQNVHDHFSFADDVIIWGINSGEHPDKVGAFMEEHKPPWPILLNQKREVNKAYGISGIPTFILIDKAGRWQHTRIGYSEWLGQELIWLIEALRAAD